MSAPLGTSRLDRPEPKRKRVLGAHGPVKVTPRHERIMHVYAPNGDVIGYAARNLQGLPRFVRRTADEAVSDLRLLLMSEARLKREETA